MWLHCWGLKAVFNSIHVQSLSQFTNSRDLGESTQLCVRTENSVGRVAIANHDFKGRFVCIVGCFTPVSTSYMSNHPHCSHTHASWVIQSSYSIVLNTLWHREQLLALLSEVVLFVLLGVLGRFQHHSSHTTPSVHTHSWSLGESTRLCNRPEHNVAREAIARHALKWRFVCTYSCFLSDSTQLGNRTENSVVRGAIHCSSCFQRSIWLRCWVFYAVFNVIYVNSHALFIYMYSCVLGESTQLCVRTENSVERGASHC